MTSSINQSSAAAGNLRLFPTQTNETKTPKIAPISVAKSKGKLLTKQIPPLAPVPNIPPSSNQTVNLIATIAAMMAAVQAMELCIAHLMSTAASAESQMQQDAASASAYSQEKNIEKTKEAEDKAAEERRNSGILKIFGYIAAALTSIISLGTLSTVAALLIVAVTVLDTVGILSKGIDAGLKACGVDPDSVLGKFLSFAVKVIVIIVATKGTGAAESAAAGAKAGTETATIAEEAEATSSGNPTMAKVMQASGMSASLNPLGDLSVALERVILGHKDEDAEGWIEMATAIITAILGMAAMFSVPATAESSLDNPVVMGKIMSATNKLAVVMSLLGAAFKIDVGVLKIQQGQIEEELGSLSAVKKELLSLVEALQAISHDQEKWMKQNNEMDKQLSQSFDYDEFANFAQVQLHG